MPDAIQLQSAAAAARVRPVGCCPGAGLTLDVCCGCSLQHPHIGQAAGMGHLLHQLDSDVPTDGRPVGCAGVHFWSVHSTILLFAVCISSHVIVEGQLDLRCDWAARGTLVRTIFLFECTHCWTCLLHRMPAWQPSSLVF